MHEYIQGKGGIEPLVTPSSRRDIFVQGASRSAMRAWHNIEPRLTVIGERANRFRRPILVGSAMALASLACRNPDGTIVPLAHIGDYISRYPNEAIQAMIEWGAGLQGATSLIGNSAAFFQHEEYRRNVGVTGGIVNVAEEAFDGAVTGGGIGVLGSVFLAGVQPDTVGFWGRLLPPAMIINFARETIMGPIQQLRALRNPRPAQQEEAGEE